MPEIAALPFPYVFDPARTALIVIDMQRDFLEPGGFGAALGNDVSMLRAIVPATARLLAGCRAAGIPVIHTQECHRPDLSDCPPAKRERGNPAVRIGDPGPMGRILVSGEPGTAIVSELAPLPGEKVVEKPGKGGFHGTGLDEHLAAAGVRYLLIAGVTTEVCVQTTMREANDRGYDCLLVEDATASYFPAFKAATLAMVRSQGGIVGWTAPVDEVLAGLGAAVRAVPAPAAAADLPSPATEADLPHLATSILGGGWASLPFEPFKPGIAIHRLTPSGTDASVALLRYAPGASAPPHAHEGLESILVLEGAQSDESGRYPAGTLKLNPAGTSHHVWSDEGCVVLIQWEKPVRFL